MTLVDPLTFEQARAEVLSRVAAAVGRERVPLLDAAGRVLAADAPADRDYPPLARSVRDGFAVRSRDLPGEFRVTGEVRAGATFPGTVGERETVEIMTGAPVPEGADQIVMVEHTSREGDLMRTERTPSPGEFINPQGAEIRQGAVMVASGTRLDFVHIAALATIGRTEAEVFRRPSVAILATGDEVVPVECAPEPNQVRNSNAWSLAAQVKRAGGAPRVLPVAPDDVEATRELISHGLQHDLLLLSGGVSAGKYDYVERVLAGLGAEFYFDRVLIQPGQPLVFGRAKGKFFFGLPGNPSSTMVTFEVFARAAVELLGGQREPRLPLLRARLESEFRHKPGLTRFLPATLSPEGASVSHVPWAGSSDVAAMARANAFLVARADREIYKAGEDIEVMLR
jgi:molybdopterin molybdotransferase